MGEASDKITDHNPKAIATTTTIPPRQKDIIAAFLNSKNFYQVLDVINAANEKSGHQRVSNDMHGKLQLIIET